MIWRKLGAGWRGQSYMCALLFKINSSYGKEPKLRKGDLNWKKSQRAGKYIGLQCFPYYLNSL